MAELRRVAWPVLALVVAAIAVIDLSDGRLQTDLLELLPDAAQASELQRAADAIDHEVGRTAILMFGHREMTVAAAAAERMETVLAAEGSLAEVQDLVDTQRFVEIARLKRAHRSSMLTLAQIESIERDGGAHLAQQALARLYGPLGSGTTDLQSDPFNLLPDQLVGSDGASALTLRGGRLWADDGGSSYTPVVFRTRAGALALDEQRRLMELLTGAEAEISAEQPDLDVLRTGIFFYAEAGARAAQTEISIVGGGSILGILMLILLTFRSLRPLAQGLLSIGVGLAFALGVTLFIFGSIHVFTLVIGASLIGVSVDYTFHFASEAASGETDWTPEKGIAHILPGITLGLITSTIAFAALTVAPFPGLRQLAVFSAVGLVGSYLTVLIMFPAWRRATRTVERPVAMVLGDALLKVRRASSVTMERAILIALTLAAAASIALVEFVDDVRVLQTRPAELLAQEHAVVSLTGADVSAPYLVLTSDSADGVLALEETLRSELDGLREAGVIGGLRGIATWVPSSAQQARSRDAYASLIERQLPELFAPLGFEASEIAAASAALMEDAGPLTLESWLRSEASADLRHLWLGTQDGVVASVVLLSAVDDMGAVRETIADLPGVTLVDRPAVLSQLFADYRVRIGTLLIAAYAVIILILAARYGLFRSIRLVWPPVVAGALALGLLSLLGVSLNLFNLLALILVLGVGIDFTLFLAESDGRHSRTYLAVTLSAATTVMSFGLLAVSQTHAISSFGATVLIGIMLSYLLAPFSLPREKTA